MRDALVLTGLATFRVVGDSEVIQLDIVRISPEKIFNCADVTACGSLRIITTLEFFEHHFAKSGHEDLLVTRQYPDHIDIVHLHAREASVAERLRSSREIGNLKICMDGYGVYQDLCRMIKSPIEAPPLSIRTAEPVFCR